MAKYFFNLVNKMKTKIIGILFVTLLFCCTFGNANIIDKENNSKTNSSPEFTFVFWPSTPTYKHLENSLSFCICDYDNDDVVGFVNWGDGCTEYTSWKECSYPEEIPCWDLEHVYTEVGVFRIRITAFDKNWNEGETKYYTIVVESRGKDANNPLLIFLHNYPNLLTLLQRISQIINI